MAGPVRREGPSEPSNRPGSGWGFGGPVSECGGLLGAGPHVRCRGSGGEKGSCGPAPRGSGSGSLEISETLLPELFTESAHHVPCQALLVNRSPPLSHVWAEWTLFHFLLS